MVLVYGAIAERKGIRQLLDAVAGAPEGSQITVLLAGVQTVGVREILCCHNLGPSANRADIVELAVELNDEQERNVFGAAECRVVRVLSPLCHELCSRTGWACQAARRLVQRGPPWLADS